MRLPQIGLLPLTLIVSVGVNVFVAGWLLGDRAGRFGPPPQPPPPRSLQPFLDSLDDRLSPEGAKIMDTMVRGFQDRGPRHFHRFEDLGERMEQALVGETFDRAAFLAAVGALNAEQTADRSEVAEQIAGAIDKLSPEDRKRLAEMKADRGFRGGIFRLLPGAPFQGPRR
jgi:uncharacterized membrane protein